ncbi:hypothetical protein THAOC_14018 [Thalassiosira oceanica]|uniref:Uncharacterized protein n=1 Tax=Thalassiosira oceanica TaxID=159749 RepID=K0SIL8_THAOC|nr:hypothetical protein THAOC_14018 [Thalassiosira oceanica]|eukprot:EJK65160.1 hypothetical protein THAOC_14018 [Thalassiosira oceanica]
MSAASLLILASISPVISGGARSFSIESCPSSARDSADSAPAMSSRAEVDHGHQLVGHAAARRDDGHRGDGPRVSRVSRVAVGGLDRVDRPPRALAQEQVAHRPVQAGVGERRAAELVNLPGVRRAVRRRDAGGADLRGVHARRDLRRRAAEGHGQRTRGAAASGPARRRRRAGYARRRRPLVAAAADLMPRVGGLRGERIGGHERRCREETRDESHPLEETSPDQPIYPRKFNLLIRWTMAR